MGPAVAGLWRLLFILLLSVIAVNFEAEPLAAEQRPYYFGRTSDQTLVHLQMRDGDEILHFRLRKAYLNFSPNWEGGLQDVISIAVIYPSMRPLGDTDKSLADADVLSIKLYSWAYTGARFNVKSLLKRKIEREWALAGQLNDSFRIYDDLTDRKLRIAREYLVPISKTPEDIFFQCYKSKSPIAGCEAISGFGGQVELNFLFRRSELAKWPDMREAVKAFLTSAETTAE
jgi:hypothetical protein